MKNDQNNEVSPNTRQRQEILNYFAEYTGSKTVILWLFENSILRRRLLTSYVFSTADLTLSRFYNTEIDTSDIPEETLKGEYESQLSDCVGKFLGTYDLKKDDFEIVPLWNSMGVEIESKVKIADSLIGVLAYSGTVDDLTSTEADLLISLISQRIKAGRDSRFVDAVSDAKRILETGDDSIDSNLRSLAQLVSKSIGARRFLYSNRNSSADWACHATIKEGFEANVCDVDFDQEIENDDEKIERVSGTVVLTNGEELKSEILLIPIYQRCFKLKNRSISTTSDLFDSLDSYNGHDISLGFFEKKVQGYLQSVFSDTDMAIAKAVFGYTEKYAQTKIFDTNYSQTIAFLKNQIHSNKVTPEKILDLLQSLSINFVNVFELNVSGVDVTSEIVLSQADSTLELSPKYLTRLKAKYLKKYYKILPEDRPDEVLMGLDKTKGGYDIEVHFPSATADSKIFVLRYMHDSISESVLKSLSHFFNELFVRVKKDENSDDRANYLMQVRHTFIHHLSAANKSIFGLHPRWDKGRRSSAYWEGLIKDPIYPTLMNKLLWSLNQAQLLLDNGRYTIGEISTIDKKPFNLEKVIANCLTIFKDQRDVKGLSTIQKVSGHKPSIMNGDESLLTIAFMNLFDNAFKYSPIERKIKYFVDYRKDHYRFELTSAGDCLDPSKKQLYFQLGQRGKQQDHLNPRHGSGLGLPIAYKILKAHSKKAELDFYPTVDDPEFGGSTNTFFFDMPYRTGHTGTDEGASKS